MAVAATMAVGTTATEATAIEDAPVAATAAEDVVKNIVAAADLQAAEVGATKISQPPPERWPPRKGRPSLFVARPRLLTRSERQHYRHGRTLVQPAGD
jgi:hypothetical protein